MPQAEKKSEKDSKLNKLIINDAGMRQGYQFQNASIADKMALLFGGEQGDEEARKILEEANKLNGPAKKKFIDDAVTKKAKKVDGDFYSGIKSLFDSLKSIHDASQGEEAKKSAVVTLMQSLGLNVNPDNVQTHFSAGPPRLFEVTWVNRPTENLNNTESPINQLADTYAGLLTDKKEKAAFEGDFKLHREQAKTGGPVIPKEKFLADTKVSFEKTVEEYKTAEQDLKSRGDDFRTVMEEARGKGESTEVKPPAPPTAGRK